MKYVDEFRDPKKADRLLREIRALVEQIPACRTRLLQIMEVCGGHTHAIFEMGAGRIIAGPRRAGAWAGLSGLRVADGAGRRLRRIG
jgi:transposase